MSQKGVNLNSVLMTIGFSLLGYGSHEVFSELKHVHDEVLVIKTDMVHRQEFDVQITELKARVSRIELEVEQIKKKTP